MKKIDFKKLLPHLIAVAIFLIVAVVYCKPALEGKVVQQHDTQGWRGMSQQSLEFKEKYGYYPLWTNSMFSGMPAYQVAMDARTHILVGYIEPVITLGLPKPIAFFFLACICFYLFCIVARANPWVSILGALAYAYATYDPIIVAVGHNTKMLSIGYIPAVLAGLLLLFQKKYWTGFAVTSLFAALLLGQGHLQIVYYTLITAGFLTLAFVIQSYRENNILPALKAAALGLIAGVLGLGCLAVTMMPTYEYAKESIRGGKSELTNKKDNNKTKGGLDKDYAFAYSVAIPETFTLIVPGIYGGSNGGREYDSNSKFAEKLSEAGMPEENAIQYGNAYSYWGAQQPTSGPVYLGAVICLLFIFGMVYVKSWHKWWIAAAGIFGILLAWGANLKGFNYFLFDHLPFYNKFRAPSMSLVIPQLCFPFLAVLAVSKLVTEEFDWNLAWKKLRLSAIITGAVFIILGGFYLTAGFSGPKDKELKENFKQNMLQQVPAGQQPSPDVVQQADEFTKGLIAALKSDRKDLMGGDLLRSIFLIAAAAVFMGLFIRKKIRPAVFITALILLSSFDLLNVGKRYLSEENFIEDTDFEAVFIPTEADTQIASDPDHANFRVYNPSAEGGPFNDSRTSYHHNSVGGYHPAKLGLYQDIIEHQLGKGNIEVFNVLNTKYFITENPATGKLIAQLNPGAYGNVWLVKGIKWVNNADEEMKALDSTNLKDTAIINRSFQSQIKQPFQYDSAASIKLKQNLNDKITYTYTATTPQFAVFSEVYYEPGWNAFVDGKKTDYAKVNYILRGMYLPAGKHDVEFRFEPRSFTIGRTITIWSNILVMLAIVGAIFFYVRRRRKPDAHVL